MSFFIIAITNMVWFCLREHLKSLWNESHRTIYKQLRKRKIWI